MLGGAGATCGVRRRRPARHACTQPHAPDDHAVLVVWLLRRRPRVRRRPSGAGRRRVAGARARAWGESVVGSDAQNNFLDGLVASSLAACSTARPAPRVRHECHQCEARPMAPEAPTLLAKLPQLRALVGQTWCAHYYEPHEKRLTQFDALERSVSRRLSRNSAQIRALPDTPAALCVSGAPWCRRWSAQ